MQPFGWTTLCWQHEDLAGRAIVAGPGALDERAVWRLSGRLRLPPSCTAEKNKNKKLPRNSHYDRYRKRGQVSRTQSSYLLTRPHSRPAAVRNLGGNYEPP